MTIEKAIDRLRKISEKTPIRTNGDDLIAITMAIQALSQEPCTDAVSREWLMRKATERFYTTNYFNHISAMIEEAPSVTQKSGKWIPVSERLPEDNQRVIVTTCGTYEDEVIMSTYLGNNMGFTCGLVKAWMPLPTPFEPQESEDKE